MNTDSNDDGRTTKTSLKTINRFLFRAKADHINIFCVLEFIERSNLANKLRGFLSARSGEQDYRLQPLHTIASFLRALTNDDADGRVLVRGGESPSLRFLLLNPEKPCEELIDQSFACVLAGGTLHPVDLLRQQLFSSVPDAQVSHFACGHVVPKENLRTFALTHGPSGVGFQFSFQQRSAAQIDELGRALRNLCSVVPQGVVVFVPSYAMQHELLQRWAATGLTFRKKLFYERSSSSSSSLSDGDERQTTEGLLAAYAHEVATAGGALLVAVMGGKLSEGINFSDGLGRCVLVVGMPYPNPHDPVLKERLARASSQLGRQSRGLYDSMCMNVVNQSVGRAIRHAADYAAIVLVDARYSQPHVQELLPAWIRSYGVQQGPFPPIFTSIASFFRSKNK